MDVGAASINAGTSGVTLTESHTIVGVPVIGHGVGSIFDVVAVVSLAIRTNIRKVFWLVANGQGR